MGKYIGHRLVARPEPDNTFWTASTNTTLKINVLLFVPVYVNKQEIFIEKKYMFLLEI